MGTLLRQPWVLLALEVVRDEKLAQNARQSRRHLSGHEMSKLAEESAFGFIPLVDADC